MSIKILFFITVALTLFFSSLEGDSKIESTLKELYEKSYKSITIDKISVRARGNSKIMENSEYEVVIQENNLLSNKGILYTKSAENKKVFFDYLIDAHIVAFITKERLTKGTTLSEQNTLKKSIALHDFRALPLQTDELSGFQIKNQIRENQIITVRDIESVVLVKRGENVMLKFDDEDVAISTTAEALKNGKLNDIISVKNSSGKKFKVRVIGKNQVEMQ